MTRRHKIVTVINSSPIEDNTHPDNHLAPTHEIHSVNCYLLVFVEGPQLAFSDA